MDAAVEMGNSKTYNMIVPGAILGMKPVVDVDAVLRGLKRPSPRRHHHLLPLNEQAIRRGMDLVKN